MGASLSKQQLFFWIIHAQVGFALLGLPYTLARSVQGDGGLVVLLGGLCIQVLLTIYWLLSKRFPSTSYFVMLRKCFGRWITEALRAVYFIYFFASAITYCIVFANLINSWILPSTPRWSLLILLIGLGTYLVVESPAVITRVFILVSAPILLLVFLIFFSYSYADIRYILPIGQSFGSAWLLAIPDVLTNYLGFEIVLFLLPYVPRRQPISLIVLTASNAFVTMLSFFLVLTSHLVFSPKEILLVPEPVLYMLKSMSLEFLERIDLFFLSVWVLPLFTSLVCYLFMMKETIKPWVQRSIGSSNAVALSAIGIFLLALLPQSPSLIEHLNREVRTASVVLVIGVPILLWGMALMLRRKGKLS